MRPDLNKAPSHRMITRSRARAVPYPNESTSVVFVGITKNNRVVASARRNIMERFNRHDTNPMNLNSSAVANLSPPLQQPSIEMNRADENDRDSITSTEESDIESGNDDGVLMVPRTLYINEGYRTDESKDSEQPSIVAPTVSNTNLSQKDSCTSLETIAASDYADEKDGSSITATEESDSESEDTVATSNVLEQPETNAQCEEEKPTIGDLENSKE